MCFFANSKDKDKMPHNSPGSTLFAKNPFSRERNTSLFENYNLRPIVLYKRLTHMRCLHSIMLCIMFHLICVCKLIFLYREQTGISMLLHLLCPKGDVKKKR